MEPIKSHAAGLIRCSSFSLPVGIVVNYLSDFQTVSVKICPRIEVAAGEALFCESSQSTFLVFFIRVHSLDAIRGPTQNFKSF